MTNLDPNRCKEKVYPREPWGGFHGYQCTRKVWKDGYCKIHHPEEVEKRRDQQYKRWKDKSENNPLALAHKKIEILEKEIEDLKAKLEEKEKGGERK